ncbi:uncharacterized protein KY384_006689 [Bacidia gigantensis]|uniref:uncharacterized protein n=1 Tax=Bacidia gigantensis TaxID=2732470 RepID=UPI001D049FFA|nr:uncharacterized protein KY384_006689 [Bacidia gigantensis]KAG8529000.1 hypothetical protein KY384_006689 [Bacidia gigantensis]
MAQEDRPLFWNRVNEVEERWIESVDDNVLASAYLLKLPEGTQVVGAFPHGASYWTRTAEIETQQVDGSSMSFFVAKGDVGLAMVSGEYVSMSELHKTIPDATPAPIGWGTSIISASLLTAGSLDIQAFTAKVAELHTKGVSPNGKYGFAVPTFMGQMPQYITWTDSWEEFFTITVQRLMSNIEESQGKDPELSGLMAQVVAKVIPRLLRPLETGGREIKPRLVHGDLYSGNVSVDIASTSPILYDATCLYAHNECESTSLDHLYQY